MPKTHNQSNQSNHLTTAVDKRSTVQYFNNDIFGKHSNAKFKDDLQSSASQKSREALKIQHKKKQALIKKKSKIK
jgi:hypothetical protein